MTHGRVVVLGGTGFVGRHLALTWRALPPSTLPLRLLVHRSHPDWCRAMCDDVRDVDLSDPPTIAATLDNCTVLINLLRPSGDGSMAVFLKALLPSIAAANVRALIHASSIDVYGAARGPMVTESTVPQPISAYEKEHLAAERLLSESEVPSMILRLGAVFGEGGRNLVSMAEQMTHERDWKLAMRRSLNGQRRLHLVAVETVAEAIGFAAHRDLKRPGELLLVTDDSAEENNFAFVQERFAAAFGRHIPKLGDLPAAGLRLLLRLRGRSADPFRRFSGERLAALGFRPSQPFSPRLARYAEVLAAGRTQVR